MQRKRTSVFWKMEESIFRNLILKSNSISDFIRRQNKRISGASFDIVKARIKALNLDTSHFKTAQQASNDTRAFTKEDVKTRVLTENSKYSSSKVKKYLFKFDIIQPKCVFCGLGEMWNNKPITLQLDHIDGVRDNNILSNLRILCPNCHTQTPTHSGRNKR